MRFINTVKTGLTIMALSGLISCAAPAQTSEQPGEQNIERSDERLSFEQIRADIALAQEAYSRIHPGYTRYASAQDMETAWDALKLSAKNGLSTGDFYLGIQTVLTEIRCDHTKAELPKSIIDWRKENPVYLPIRWSLVEGRGLVRLAGEATGLEFGDEILAIDGRPLPAIIDAVDDYIPVDGYTEWSKTAGVSESLEFRGGAVDHFGALLWDVKPKATLRVRTRTGPEKTAEKTIEEKTIEIDRVHFDIWSALGAQNGDARNFKDAVTFQRIEDDGAYLRIDSFVNYRDTIEPDKIYDPIFDALKDEEREYLILDLRNNGGGSDDASRGLINRLMLNAKDFNKDVRVATVDLDGLREHLWTWDKSAMSPNKLAFSKNDDGSYSFRKFAGQHGKIKPEKNAFTGELYVLTSNANSSGSAAILAHLKDSGRATFIGEKAGGSAEGPTAGLLFTLTLPESGIKTRIPAIRAYHNIESFEPGLSISPDVYAPMTVKAFLEKRDPAMEAALKLAGEN